MTKTHHEASEVGAPSWLLSLDVAVDDTETLCDGDSYTQNPRPEGAWADRVRTRPEYEEYTTAKEALVFLADGIESCVYGGGLVCMAQRSDGLCHTANSLKPGGEDLTRLSMTGCPALSS